MSAPFIEQDLLIAAVQRMDKNANREYERMAALQSDKPDPAKPLHFPVVGRFASLIAAIRDAARPKVNRPEPR